MKKYISTISIISILGLTACASQPYANEAAPRHIEQDSKKLVDKTEEPAHRLPVFYFHGNREL